MPGSLGQEDNLAEGLFVGSGESSRSRMAAQIRSQVLAKDSKPSDLRVCARFLAFAFGDHFFGGSMNAVRADR
jgi:hypothetical protein